MSAEPLRILMLATRYAVPPDSGYATDIHGMVEQLGRQGVEVRLLLVDDGKAHRTEFPERLRAGGVKLGRVHTLLALVRSLLTGRAFVACKWRSRALVEQAVRLHQRWPFALVQACGLFHTENALAIGRRCGAKVVLRSQNVESAICRRMAEAMPPGVRQHIWKREAILLRKQEAAWCQDVDLVFPISDEDGTVLKAFAPRTPMVTVQTGAVMPEVFSEPCEPVSPPCFLHMGSLDWPPRLEGFLWFLHDVWPLVRDRMPGARLAVAGSLPDSVRAQLLPWRERGVEAHGFVDDLAGLARTCAAVVVPMRCGGGIKIRVLTAWAQGWPVVGTTGMGQGLPAQDGVNCLMADEPSALADALQRVVNPDLRASLSQAGREVIRANYSWDAIGRVMQEAHRRLGACGQGDNRCD